MSWIFSGLAWGLTAFCGMTLWNSFYKGVATVKRLHQIPCANCQYFTANYVLKCAVHPDRALTESAVGCQDYAELKSY